MPDVLKEILKEEEPKKEEEEKKEEKEEAKKEEEEEEEFTGPVKAAILLRAIGEDIASEILKKLPEEYVQAVTERMVYLDFIPMGTVNKVAREFCNLMERDVIMGSGLEYIHKILVQVFGPSKAAAIMERLKIFLKVGGEQGLGVLKELDTQAILNFIRKEHPQTVAVILAYLDPAKAAEVLSMLPEDLYGEVAERIANLDRLSPGVMDDIGLILDEEFRTRGRAKRVGGVMSLAEILNNTGATTEKAVINALEQKDPELAEEVRRRMFTFEDMIRIPDRGIQMLLREVDRDDLLKALKASSDQIKGKFFKNMSERARNMLRDDLEAIGPIRLSDAEKAQQNIIKIVRRMEEEGELVIPGRGDVVL